MFGAAELLKKEGPDLLRAFIRSRRGAVGADLRFEVMFSRSSSATDGEARSAHEGESAGFSVSVRVDEPLGRLQHRSDRSRSWAPRAAAGAAARGHPRRSGRSL